LRQVIETIARSLMTSLDHDRPVTDPLIGQLLGKDYRVLERIGTGGMGVVYLVEHAALKKRFAAKVLSSELAASAEARARFQTEAHAASQLEHENIVTITDYVQGRGGRSPRRHLLARRVDVPAVVRPGALRG
jgi:serine/threonine protein kinase